MVSTEGVLLVDWQNLSGAIVDRGKAVRRKVVDDLWAFANDKANGELPHSHMASAEFDPSIYAAMREHMIKAHIVRSTKEQADIALTVLAMDHLHSGCRTFVLVTGDQDFVPLIERLRNEGCKVVVVFGDSAKLTASLRAMLQQPGIESFDIDSISPLQDRPRPTGPKSFLGLLELQRQGKILGGRNPERTQLLAQWNVIGANEETLYWELIPSFTAKVQRHTAARRIENQWVAHGAARTYLSIDPTRMNEILRVDYLVRQICARPSGVAIDRLRTGPFRTDDGAILDELIETLVSINLAYRAADRSIVPTETCPPEGYLEYLWRVYAGVASECFKISRTSLPYGQVSPMLYAQGVGQAPNQKAASRISAALDYSKSFGIVDSIVEEPGQRRLWVNTTGLVSRRFDAAYAALYILLSQEPGLSLTERGLLDRMTTHDESRVQPDFGWDNRDRHRIIRILAQSRLLSRNDGHIGLVSSNWGEQLTSALTHRG